MTKEDRVVCWMAAFALVVWILFLLTLNGCANSKIVTYDHLPSYGRPRTEQTFSYEPSR